ncbi:TIGR03087 family PEP-CTERM/XrtA system glycosyltransferase [Rhodopila sp.]|uniref:TIGR03087 family PEP-CTERM/XrtA system glycosyltransferase n=1 Tax=Rhodopila sp. TaxID=2480087 RepID=UPI003D09F539
MPSLLFLTQRLPYPPIKGEKIRPLQILKYLSQWYDVHLGCLIDDPADEPYIETIRALCQDIHVARLNRRLARLSCLRGLLTGESLSVTFFRDRGLARWVRDVVVKIRPEVIFVNSSNMAPYVLDLPRTGTRIVDLADVDSEKWRAYADKATGPMRLVYHREWRRMAELERRIAHEFNLSSFVSDAEAALFASQVPDCASRIRGVSSGVDHRYFDPSLQHAPVYDLTVPTYVFTGTMDYPPNVDAVAWFVTEILPVIRLRLPAARFYIVGNNPSPDVERLTQTEGVVVTGRVPDVRPYVAHATASVAPMRIARGIQNKVLEAMSLARPVVLTSGALEGIAAVPGQEVILADTIDDFATACVRLATLGDQTGIGPKARLCVLRDYDWSVTLRRFDDLLRPPQSARLPADT